MTDSLDKSALRAAMATEIGSAVDDALEAAEGQIHFFEGGVSALVQTAAQVQLLAKLVDEDLDGKGEGEIADLTTAKLVKKYITRAVAIIESGAKSAENKKIKAEGKRDAYTATVGEIKKRVDIERGKVHAVKSRLEALVEGVVVGEGESDLRPVGTHPDDTIKTKRQAEAIAAEQAPKEKPKRATKPRKQRAPRKPRATKKK